MVLSSEGTPMFTFMLAGEDSESIQQAHRRMIIVGVDDSAEGSGREVGGTRSGAA
jgi:hypothetical protein